LDARQVDGAGEPRADEDAEAVTGAELPLALARAALGGERPTVLAGVGMTR
jgi:hypothetical protein